MWKKLLINRCTFRVWGGKEESTTTREMNVAHRSEQTCRKCVESVSSAYFRSSMCMRYALALKHSRFCWRLQAAYLYDCIAVMSPPSQHVCCSLLAVKRVQTVRIFYVFHSTLAYRCAKIIRVVDQRMFSFCAFFLLLLFLSKLIYFIFFVVEQSSGERRVFSLSICEVCVHVN